MRALAEQGARNVSFCVWPEGMNICQHPGTRRWRQAMPAGFPGPGMQKTLSFR